MAGPINNNNFLLHITDNSRNEKWLVDGGALISIIPPTPQQRRRGPDGTKLRAANGSSIACYGTTNRSITIGKETFAFSFTIADVQQRILGADFLAHNYLAPNHRDAELLNLQDFSTLPAEHARNLNYSPVNYIRDDSDPYNKLLDTYPDILTPTFRLKNPEHGVKHRIPTDPAQRPVQSRARRLDPEKLAVAKKELGKLEELGICYKGRSEWSSPLLVTTKPCGGWRVCGDYRRVNAMTTDDRYPVRTLQDFTSELHGKKFFSKVDLMKGYHQIPVAEEDIGKTAVITPFGLYVFPCTPFGLKNAGQDFQRLMDEILGDLPRVFVYIDDILIASESREQHLQDLDTVFKTLAANGLVVQRSKCLFGQSSLEFLGYHVDQNGIAPLPHRVEAISAATPPTTVKELQRFLGMVGYYRRFIPKAARHLFHLFEALKGPNDKKPKTLEWTKDCQASFDATKKALADATLLFHPRPGAQLALTTDASNMAIGAVLEQRGPDGWEPLAFYSSKLEPHQRMWPPYDRELLAAYKGTRHFRPYVEGRPFTLYTDHQSLIPSIHKKTDPQTLRQTYQLGCISEYTTDIRYLEGKANVVADALSRPNEEAPEVSAVTSGSSISSETHTSLSPPNWSVFSPKQTSTTPSPSSPMVSPTATAAAAAPSSSTSSNSDERKTEARERFDAATSDLEMVVNAIGDLGMDWVAVARQQPLDPEFRQLRDNVRSGLDFRSVDIGQTSLIVDFSNGPARPYIPFQFRKRVFELLHGLGHPGVERTRKAICSKVVWPSIREDVSKWARECLHCQRSKVVRHVTPPIGTFEVPNKRFEHCNIDIVTMPVSNGYHYLLTAVDRFSRWPIAVPMTDMTAASVLDAFSYGWIQHYGIPASVTTDRGVQFTSEIFKQLVKAWGINSHLTAPYHPEANGLVERFHRRMKESLIALGHEAPEEWFWRLPMTMLCIRTTVKPDVGASPADLVYGEGLAVPGEVLPANPADEERLVEQRAAALADLRLEVSRLMPTPTSAHRRPLVHMPDDLATCTHVFVRRGAGGAFSALRAPYVGPFRVTDRNNVNFRIAIPGRANETVAISRVKPAYASAEDLEDTGPQPRQPRRAARSPTPPRRNRRRPRPQRIESDDESADDAFPPSFPADADEPVQMQDEYDEPPDWNPPDWFDPDANDDDPVDAELPTAQHSPPPSPRPDPPPPPPPPPRRRGRKKHKGNPNWARGGTFAGANHGRRFFAPDEDPQPAVEPEPVAPQTPPRRHSSRLRDADVRRRPDVSAISSLISRHLGLEPPSVSSGRPPTHRCDLGCVSD